MRLRGLPRVRRRSAGRSAKKRTRPDLSPRHIQYARALGLFFCAAGFVAIGLGWVGAAGQACVDCQIPYLLSGGAAGLALVVFGVAMLLLAQVRSECRRVTLRLDDVLRAALAPATTARSDQTPMTEVPERPFVSPNGHGEAEGQGSEAADRGSRTARLAKASGPDPSAASSAASRPSGRRITGWWERSAPD